MRRFDKDKNIEKVNILTEQRYIESKGLLKEDVTSDKEIDLANSNDTDYNICDDMSSNTKEELIDLLNNTKITPEDRVKIQSLLDELTSTNKRLSNDGDNVNLIQHKIGSTLCR